MLEKSFIIAFIVFGIHYIIYTPKMILYFIRQYAVKIRMQDWLAMPLFDCPICMSPYWGSLIYWLAWGNSGQQWLLCIFTAMGINAVIVFLKNG